MVDTPPSYLETADGERLAYRRRAGTGVGAVWLCGFMADMLSPKAEALDAWALETARPVLRFDYFGHGESSGDFRAGTISRWVEDTIAALDDLTDGPQVLVAPSMGAWVAVHAATARPHKVAGIVFIAPSMDFTETLLWARFPDKVKDQIMTEGAWEQVMRHTPKPYVITKGLIEDGRQNLVLDGPVALACPVRILHGMKDLFVPWEHSLDLTERLMTNDVVIHLIKDGDHPLADDHHLEQMIAVVDRLCRDLDADGRTAS